MTPRAAEAALDLERSAAGDAAERGHRVARRQPPLTPVVTEQDRLSAALRAGRHQDPEALATGLRAFRAFLERDRAAPAAEPLAVGMAISASMVRLRALATTSAMIDAAPAELCRACGVSRAMISRVTGTSWIPEAFHPPTGPLAAGFPLRQGTAIPLRVMALETEMTRRRASLMVRSPQTDRRVSAEFIRDAACGSYVVAPIVCGGRVIAFFHADHLAAAGDVDATDRDNVTVFAREFGLVFEALVLKDRLDHQTTTLCGQLTQRALATAELDTERAETPVPPRATAVRRHDDGWIPPAAAKVLSPRELEVLMLIVSGATNRDIGVRLTITTGTVKSHVKRVLQKLRVSSRSEAAAWYLRQRQSAA